MFNKEESHIFWKCTGTGAAVGGALCGVLLVWTLFADLWNCFCDCLISGRSKLPEANSFFTYLFVFLISVVIGIIVGYAQASSARSKRRALEKRNHQTDNQKETVKELQNFVIYAERTSGSLFKQFNEIRYHHNSKKDTIDIALNKCKKKKEETESIMNRLISNKD